MKELFVDGKHMPRNLFILSMITSCAITGGILAPMFLPAGILLSSGSFILEVFEAVIIGATVGAFLGNLISNSMSEYVYGIKDRQRFDLGPKLIKRMYDQNSYQKENIDALNFTNTMLHVEKQELTREKVLGIAGMVEFDRELNQSSEQACNNAIKAIAQGNKVQLQQELLKLQQHDKKRKIKRLHLSDSMTVNELLTDIGKLHAPKAKWPALRFFKKDPAKADSSASCLLPNSPRL